MASDRLDFYTSTGAIRLKLQEQDWGVAVERAVRSADPESIDTLRAHADRHLADESWQRARPWLERLIERLDPEEDREDLCSCHVRLGQVGRALGDLDLAIEQFRASTDVDPTYLPGLLGLASALIQVQEWEEASEVLERITREHRSTLTEPDRLQLDLERGEAALGLDRIERADELFLEVLRVDEENLRALKGRLSVAERSEDWELVHEVREQLIERLEEPDRIFEALVAQGQLSAERLTDPFRAIEAYAAARRLRPEELSIARTLLRLYESTGQTSSKVELLGSLVDRSEPAPRRARYLEIAEIWAADGDTASAVSLLNHALDEDPTFIVAFEQLEVMLFEAREWQTLAACYRRMIERLPEAQTRARAILWRSLAMVCQRGLKSMSSARAAYEAALESEPDSEDVTVALADLYATDRETAPQALALYHQLFATSEDPAVPARKLFELYFALGSRDRAFCALGALIALGQATEAEREAYRLLRKRAAKNRPERPLNQELIRCHMLHPDCRTALADVLCILYRAAPELFNQTQRHLRLKPTERVDPMYGSRSRAGLRFVDLSSRISEVLGVKGVEHFHRPKSDDAPRLCPGLPAVMYAGAEHGCFKVTNQSHLTFTLARELTVARPELALALGLPKEELMAVIEAAARLCHPGRSFSIAGLDPRSVGRWERALGRVLGEDTMASLKNALNRCLSDLTLEGVIRFMKGAEQTAWRVAFLLAQDATLVEVDVADPGRGRALAGFALSEDHAVLRESLGLAID